MGICNRLEPTLVLALGLVLMFMALALVLASVFVLDLSLRSVLGLTVMLGFRLEFAEFEDGLSRLFVGTSAVVGETFSIG